MTLVLKNDVVVAVVVGVVDVVLVAVVVGVFSWLLVGVVVIVV